MWPTTGQETIDHYEVKCSEVQPFDGYNVTKLEVTSLTKVSRNHQMPRLTSSCSEYFWISANLLVVLCKHYTQSYHISMCNKYEWLVIIIL